VKLDKVNLIKLPESSSPTGQRRTVNPRIMEAGERQLTDELVKKKFPALSVDETLEGHVE
jgi:hypothetical protein